MPNRTIYVADADLPIFEKAQKLAGDNLSAAIVHALRIFVEKEEARSSGYKEIIVKVGKGRPYFTKQFRGRPLATRRLSIQNGARLLTLTVYQTAKGRFALYTRNTPNWANWSSRSRWPKRPREGDVSVDINVDVNSEDWSHSDDWSYWEQWGHDWARYYGDDEYRLDVFDTLDELKEHIPEELYEAIVRHVNGEDVEILDI